LTKSHTNNIVTQTLLLQAMLHSNTNV